MITPAPSTRTGGNGAGVLIVEILLTVTAPVGPIPAISRPLMTLAWVTVMLAEAKIFPENVAPELDTALLIVALEPTAQYTLEANAPPVNAMTGKPPAPTPVVRVDAVWITNTSVAEPLNVSVSPP